MKIFKFSITIYIILTIQLCFAQSRNRNCDQAHCSAKIDTLLYNENITLDGVLSEGEWNLTQNLTPYFSNEWHACYGNSNNKVSFGTFYDESYLFIGIKSSFDKLEDYNYIFPQGGQGATNSNNFVPKNIKGESCSFFGSIYVTPHYIPSVLPIKALLTYDLFTLRFKPLFDDDKVLIYTNNRIDLLPRIAFQQDNTNIIWDDIFLNQQGSFKTKEEKLMSRFDNFGIKRSYKKIDNETFSIEVAIPWEFILNSSYFDSIPPNIKRNSKIYKGKKIGFELQNLNQELNTPYVIQEGENATIFLGPFYLFSNWNKLKTDLNCFIDNSPLIYGSKIQNDGFGTLLIAGKTKEDLTQIMAVNERDSLICKPGKYYYTVGAVFDQDVKWQVNGGIIEANLGDTILVNWQKPGLKSIIAFKKDSCSGKAGKPDTLNLEVLGDLSFTGPLSVCPGTDSLLYTLNYPSYFNPFSWTVLGANVLNSPSQSSILVEVPSVAGNAFLFVAGKYINSYCGTSLNSAIVKIESNLSLPEPIGLSIWCQQDVSAKEYFVPNSPNSIYIWSVVGGNIISGRDSSKVFVIWDANSPINQIFVAQKTVGKVGNCEGTSPIKIISIIKPYDKEPLVLEYLTIKENNEKNIKLEWKARPQLSIDSIAILYDRISEGNIDWQNTINLKTKYISDTLLRKDLNTDDEVYFATLLTKDQCGNYYYSNTHNSILLKAESQNEESATLRWNQYLDWNQGVDKYEVWFKGDQNNYELLATTLNTYQEIVGNNAFQHSYRVKAVKKGGDGTISWSNEINLSFANEVEGVNIFTPNGDGLNEKFVFKNLRVYSKKTLKIYNRLGVKVYESNHYDNGFEGKDLEDGVYYYLLNYGTSSQDKNMKGWVQILR